MVRIQRLRASVGVRCLDWRQHHFGVLCAEDVVERSAELPDMVADEEAHPASLLLQCLRAVEGMRGYEAPSGLAVTPAKCTKLVSSSMPEQHVQPTQPDSVNGEAGRRRGSRRPAGAGMLARWWRFAVGRVEAVAAE